MTVNTGTARQRIDTDLRAAMAKVSRLMNITAVREESSKYDNAIMVQSVCDDSDEEGLLRMGCSSTRSWMFQGEDVKNRTICGVVVES